MSRFLIFFTLIAALMRCSSPSIVATQSVQLGDVANNRNQYDEAIRHYEEYLKITPQLGLYRNPKMEASVMRKLAHAYATQGKYLQSVKLLRKALVIDSVNHNRLEFMDDYRQLGLVHGYSGNLLAAKQCLQKSLTLNEGLETSVKESKRNAAADTYLSLAQLELSLGNYKTSKELAKKAESLYANLPDGHLGIIECKLITGIVERETGQLESSRKFIEESQEISRQHRLNTSRHAQALSEICFLKGDPQNAIRFKIEALEEAEKTNIKPQVIMACMRLGDAYQRLGDPDHANFYYHKALSIQAQGEIDTVSSADQIESSFGDARKVYDYYLKAGSSTGLALISLRLGERYFGANNLDSAAFMYRQAKESFQKSGSNEGVAKADLELSRVLINQQKFSSARKVLDEADHLTIQQDLKWQIFLRKGIIHESTQAFDSALYCYKKSIEVINQLRSNITIEEFKTLFTNTKIEAYDRIIMLLLQDYKGLKGYTMNQAVSEAFMYNEESRSRTFLDMLGNKRIEAKQVGDREVMEEEQLLKLKIQQLSRELNTNTSDIGRQQLAQELYHAQDDYDKLIHKIKLSNESYSMVTPVDPPRLSEIQSRLDAQTVILEYWISNDNLVCWTISKNKIQANVVAVSRRNLHREVVGCRNSIEGQHADIAEVILKRLYKTLIAPVSASLSGYKNVVIVPHKDLHFLPFQALQSEANKFLIEQFVLSYAPSASVYYYCLSKTPAAGNKFLGLALGDVSIGDFSELPGTQIEVDQLEKIYPEMVSVAGKDFSETYFKLHSKEHNYIHMATHGVLDEEQPLYSYLLMSPTDQDDGRLTVDEIFSLELQTKFVTLSACETALGELGEGDDLVGLSRAFIYAGSPGVIVSLWQVDDATTAWLMTRFHQYINAGFNAAESITFAQRDIIQRNFTASKSRGLKSVELSPDVLRIAQTRNNKTSRNPYFWAPFVIIGNGFVK